MASSVFSETLENNLNKALMNHTQVPISTPMSLLNKLCSGSAYNSSLAQNKTRCDATSPFDQILLLVLLTASLLTIGLSVVSIVSNSLCITIFTKMLPKDGITVTFLGLSTADFLVSVGMVPNACLVVCYAIEQAFSVKLSFAPFPIFLQISFFPMTLSTVSSLITAFMAVTRSLSVARPVHFKEFNTPRKSVVVIVASFLIAFINFVVIPFRTPRTNVPMFINGSRNESTISSQAWKVGEQLTSIMYMITRLGVSSITFITLVVGAAVMLAQLRKASRFRAASSKPDEERAEGGAHKDGPNVKKDVPHVKKDGSRLSSKEQQAVVQVLLISLVYLATCLPAMAHTLASNIVPGYKMGHQHGRLFFTFTCIMGTFLQINSFVNVFIFYHYNSRFRDIFIGLYRCVKQKKKK